MGVSLGIQFFGTALASGLGVLCIVSCVKVPQRDGVAAADVNAIIRRIKCDLNTIVLEKAYQRLPDGRQPFLFLRSWAAKIHLTLTVDDNVQINPGASVTTPLHTVNNVAQTFTLGIGAGLTTQAVRQEDVEFLLSFKDIDTENNNGRMYTPLYDFCIREPGLLLESDLGLDFLIDAALKPIETGILKPGNNIGPNAGAPPATPRADLSKIDAVQVRAVDPGQSIHTLASQSNKNELISKKLIQKFNIPPDVAEMTTTELNEKNPAKKDDAEVIKELLANSTEATAVETKTQAIINNIVKPRYNIAVSSLDGSCVTPAIELQFEALAHSANVSAFVIDADKAAEKAADERATPSQIQQALVQSTKALDGANKERIAVISATNSMADKMSLCAVKTRAIKLAKKKEGPPVYDPISTISETVNFYITATGNITPSWKLVRLTAPLSGNFISGTRKDTNSLILSMGRPIVGPNGSAQASPAMDAQVLYSILGQAVSSTRP